MRCILSRPSKASVDELLDGIVQAARRKGAKLPFAANTAYVNTIAKSPLTITEMRTFLGA